MHEWKLDCANEHANYTFCTIHIHFSPFRPSLQEIISGIVHSTSKSAAFINSKLHLSPISCKVKYPNLQFCQYYDTCTACPYTIQPIIVSFCKREFTTVFHAFGAKKVAFCQSLFWDQILLVYSIENLQI